MVNWVLYDLPVVNRVWDPRSKSWSVKLSRQPLAHNLLYNKNEKACFTMVCSFGFDPGSSTTDVTNTRNKRFSSSKYWNKEQSRVPLRKDSIKWWAHGPYLSHKSFQDSIGKSKAGEPKPFGAGCFWLLGAGADPKKTRSIGYSSLGKKVSFYG